MVWEERSAGIVLSSLSNRFQLQSNIIKSISSFSFSHARSLFYGDAFLTQVSTRSLRNIRLWVQTPDATQSLTPWPRSWLLSPEHRWTLSSPCLCSYCPLSGCPSIWPSSSSWMGFNTICWAATIPKRRPFSSRLDFMCHFMCHYCDTVSFKSPKIGQT